MVGQTISWKSIINSVGDRMIDGSLTHMFTNHRKIRRKTQFVNRELRQMYSVNSYKKFTKIKKAVLQIAPEDDDTDEDYFSNNDFDDTHKSAESIAYNKECENKKIYTDDAEIDELKLCEIEIDEEITGQYLNEESESKSDIDEEVDDIKSPIIENKRFPVKENIKRNLVRDFDQLSNCNADVMVHGDSGIDEDSVDSEYVNSTRIDCIKKKKQIVEEPDHQTLKTSKKSQPKITCTEIITSKYRILPNGEKKQENSNTNENSESSIVEQTDDFPEQIAQSDTENDGEKSQQQRTILTVPNEIDSLKYILTNLRIHNRYEDNFFKNNYGHETTNEYQPDDSQTNHIELPRPVTLDELIEFEDLIEIKADSTLTFTNITEDEEIFLIEIPKSVIDDKDLMGKKMKIEKKSVLIDDAKYEAYHTPIEDFTCIMKKEDDDTSYEIRSIKPKASLVLRQKPSEQDFTSHELISNLADSADNENQCVPFPKNLKRRNPLVLQPDSNTDYLKRKKVGISESNSITKEESW